MPCLETENGFICMSNIEFNCPYCGKKFIDSDEKYHKRINRNKSCFTTVKCDCLAEFYLTYDYAGNFMTQKINKINDDEDIYNFVMVNGGFIEFDKPMFSNIWNIKSIKAVEFKEQFDFGDNANDWNDYVVRYKVAIGVENYCHLVHDCDNNVAGIMAFYDKDGKEIKVKHFKSWKYLVKKLWKK